MEEDLVRIFGPAGMPGLDIERGLDAFDGDTDIYIITLRSFVKNTPDVIDKLRNVTEGNLTDYAINVHGLKSSSGWICAENIRERAAELEALAKAGDLSGVIARNDKFLKDADIFVKELGALLDKNSGE
jgi:HPt (histidine-containing phosphotransfer) domain-containing protein